MGRGVSRKAFIESHGATCRSWTWSWSFVNHDDQMIILSAIHKPHLPQDGASVYRGISGEQFHGSSAS